MQELLERDKKENEAAQYANVDVEDLLDDPELEKLHEEQISQLKTEREKRQLMSHQGHGELTDITEGEFLNVVTNTKFVVCHFAHKDFERCKIMDKHLRLLASKYFVTRFCRINAPDAAFFVAKLSVQMLPCVIFFVNGVAVDRVVGFDELGGKDDFATTALETRLLHSGVIEVKTKQAEHSEPEQQRSSVRKSAAAEGRVMPKDGDEDSDFD
jgi:thioredoxin-like negative regulator of GroEL